MVLDRNVALMAAAALKKEGDAMLDGRVRDIVVVIIAVAWLTSRLYSMANPDYKVDPGVDAAFALVVGAVIGVGKKENGKDRNDDDQPPRKAP